MKRFPAFSLVLTAAVLLTCYLTRWSPHIYAHEDLGTSPVFKITENTQGPVRLNLSIGTPDLYSIDSTDADSQKFEISHEKRSANQQSWQDLQFKSDSIPDYENPADADADNDYEITLAYGSDGVTHTHDVTIRVTNVKAPEKMSAPTLEVLTTDVKVSWTAVSHAYLTGYEVHWVHTSNASDTDSKTVEDTLISTTIDLTGGTYDIKVRALSSEGNSEWSDTASITTNSAPTPVGPIPAQVMAVNGGTRTIDLNDYFSDPDGQTLVYTASSSNTGIATVSLSTSNLTITGMSSGTATVTVTATDTFATASQTISVTVKDPPTAVGTIPNISGAVNQAGKTFALSPYFSDPDGQTLTYAASASDTYYVSVYVNSSNELEVTPQAAGNATITVTATNPDGLSATQSFSVAFTESVFVGEADAIPGLSSEAQLQLGASINYDTLIFNELHNGSDDTNDWLELRNVSAAPLSLDDWELSLLMDAGNVVVTFPAGTMVPAGDVLLLVNTAPIGTGDTDVSSVVVDTFALPQEEFALILQGPSGIGDLAVNYFQAETQPSETAPVLTVDTVWQRNQPIVSGYLAEAWSQSSTQGGFGTPGYRHSSETADLNNDGTVDILDLVLVASQFNMKGTAADLNADGTVNIQDLVLVANAVNDIAAAPTAQQSQASMVNNWLQLARQNATGVVQTAIPEGFSYARGIQVLEQLARALVPEATALLANYPNPFNPETWIPYQLAKGSEVTVTIYASDGSVVRTLALGHQAAGMYKNRAQAAYWDGTNALGETVASGLYFYTLTAGDFVATRRMLILK